MREYTRKLRIEKGDFVEEDKKVYYIYELIMDGRSQTGIVACASIDDYINNVIKKHENTRADKEVDRIKHVSACEAQTGPIFLAYRSNDIINGIVDKIKKTPALYDFVAEDGITHKAWIISDESDIEQIEKAFEGMDYVKKESNTEPVNDMYDEKVPLMARISAFFKKMF